MLASNKNMVLSQNTRKLFLESGRDLLAFPYVGKDTCEERNAIYVKIIHLYLSTNIETFEGSILVHSLVVKMGWVNVALSLGLKRRHTLFLPNMKQPQGSHISSIRCPRAL